MSSSRTQIKNRAPAPIQISAEQILREAKDRGLEEAPPPPKQFITDGEELRLYQQSKRKDFEDQLRRQRQKIGIWCKYAIWESVQREFERSRSVFERALDVDYTNQMIWLKYAEMEMKNKFLNHARNVLDRAVSLLPRVDIFWLKYTYMEEFIGAIDETRQVFERWMKWEPSDTAWHSYINFEMRQQQIGRARGIYERYIRCHPTTKAFLKYAKWEEKNREYSLARQIYERSFLEVHPMERSVYLYINFAQFEERCKEYERARVIYNYALDNIDENSSRSEAEKEELKQHVLNFEKKYGNKQSIEEVILKRRREHYEKELLKDVYNYDTWFNYIRLEEKEDGNEEKIRDVYERAISNVPPVNEKKYWRRYIYLWINYALFEELQAKDMHRTRAVYQACLQLIPHKIFTFGKIWMMAAHFEVRQNDLSAARKILGKAIGLTSKENIFKGYIELEMQLGEIDRCRIIYNKYIESMPWNSTAWKNFAQLEVNLGESERARSIYELAIQQNEMDMPELLWKTYIDFEIAEGEYQRVRGLYERLLQKTSHVKVWISYAQFEGSLSGAGEQGEIDQETIYRVRELMDRGYAALKAQGLKEERIMLLETWRDLEARASMDVRDVEAVESKFPRKIKMRRPIVRSASNIKDDDDDGNVEFEEYYEYQFPDDATKIVGLKLLENAMKWKQAAAAAASASIGEDSSGTSGDLSGILESSSQHKRKLDDEDQMTTEPLASAHRSMVTDSNEIDLDI
jgi:crooked neck